MYAHACTYIYIYISICIYTHIYDDADDDDDATLEAPMIRLRLKCGRPSGAAHSAERGAGPWAAEARERATVRSTNSYAACPLYN
jgi:hypothetical protein